MKNRASTHLLALLLIIAFQVMGYVAVYRAALLRGYEPSLVGAVRDLVMYMPIFFLVVPLPLPMVLPPVIGHLDCYSQDSAGTPGGFSGTTG